MTDTEKSIALTKHGFEESFSSGEFYLKIKDDV